MSMKNTNSLISLGGAVPTDGANRLLAINQPYTVSIRIRGVADLLLHRWNCEAIAAKGAARKGSAQKRSDDLESYIYRDEKGYISLPGTYFRACLINASKFLQDPRSPRKSAQDLFKAGVLCVTPFASLGVKAWDYEHKFRAVVQRSGITRCLPALKAGWEAEFVIQVNLPEYIDEILLRETCDAAGKLIGLADMRPTYGRFTVIQFGPS